MAEKLRNDYLAGNAQGERRFYIVFPNIKEHQNHAVYYVSRGVFLSYCYICTRTSGKSLTELGWSCFALASWPGDSENTVQSSSRATIFPFMYLLCHLCGSFIETVSLMRKVKQGSCE